jgi:hypothetical protein
VAGGLRDRQAREVAQLDQLGDLWFGDRQLGERFVQREQIFGGLGCRNVPRIELLATAAASMLAAALAPSVFDQDPAHRLGGRRKELPSARPLLFRVSADKPQISLMHQRCGAECLPGFFLSHLCRCKFAQLIVDQRQKLVGGTRIAFLDRRKNPGDFTHDDRRPRTFIALA